ncbi:MAG TPA: nuclear transport factor 2 family protein [Pseudonocardiaceae bacterium]
MDRDAAQEFATAWAQDWNDHDLDRIMRHFAEDVVFRSPVAAQLLDVYTGIDTIVINYRNRAGQLVNEILSFDGGLVVAGHGTYGPPPA